MVLATAVFPLSLCATAVAATPVSNLLPSAPMGTPKPGNLVAVLFGPLLLLLVQLLCR